MPYPWASFGGFKFKADEKPIWGTDAGWGRTPSYARQKLLGAATDSVIGLSIGSAERTFEVYLTPERFDILEIMLNSKATFTDWSNPPDSREAFLTELSPIEDAVSMPNIHQSGYTRKRKTKVTLVSA